MLTYTLKLRKITRKEEVMKEQAKRRDEQMAMMQMSKNQEPKILANYLEENKITAKPTKSGLYFMELKKGSGPKAKVGDSISVNYTVRLLDGRVIDTNDKALAKTSGVYYEGELYDAPRKFPLVEGEIFKGWLEALPMMNTGTKAKLILPSNLALGEQGRGSVPPFSPMVFEVELVGTKSMK